MQFMKDWIIRICTVVVFIAAVNMVIPKNSFKKYSKFVLGLILIIVVINPILELFSKGKSVSAYANEADNFINSKSYDQDIKYSKKENIKSTNSIFQENLNEACEKALKSKYPDYNWNVVTETSYDDDSNKFTIKSIKVYKESTGVKAVKKVEIGKSSSDNENAEYDEDSAKIKNYISSTLSVSQNIISVYKK